MTSVKISTPVLPAYILVIVMALLPCSDMMIIKNCITEITLRSFVLDVLIHDEFVEGFCGNGNVL